MQKTLSFPQPRSGKGHSAGVKITRGPRARGPYLGGRAPRSPSLGARNIENEKIFDISTVGPADYHEGP